MTTMRCSEIGEVMRNVKQKSVGPSTSFLLLTLIEEKHDFIAQKVKKYVTETHICKESVRINEAHLYICVSLETNF